MTISNKGIITTTGFSEVGPTNGLVGWWPLKHDTKDYTINRNDGVNNGATIASRGYAFDGSVSEVTIANDPNLDLSGDITISFWIYVDSIVSRTTLVNKAYGGEFTINLETSGDIRCYRGLGGGNATPYSQVDTSPITQDSWQFYTARANYQTLTVYFNGSQEGTATHANFEGSVSTANIVLGTGYTGGHLNGFLSDVRIYNRALSEEEINILYEITNPELNTQMKISPTTTYIKGQFIEN